MGRYIYPPRPEGKILPSQLQEMEDTGEWLCQRKFNGDRCPIQFSDGKVVLWNRRGKKQKYRVPRSLLQALQALNLSGECWLDSELMHPRVEDTIVIYDVLQLSGKYLIGVSQLERLTTLNEVCRTPVDIHPILGYSLGQGVFLAQSWESNFTDHFEESKDVEYIEGLVLRRKESCLTNFGSNEYEVDWQVRCRRSTKNYRH